MFDSFQDDRVVVMEVEELFEEWINEQFEAAAEELEEDYELLITA